MRKPALVLTALTALTVALTSAASPVAAGTASQTGFPETIELPDGWQPEGITSGQGSEFFVGSLAAGAVWRGDFRSGQGSEFIPGGSPPAVGLAYDSRRGRLWVAGGDTGQVRVYDAGNGRLLRSYTVPGSGFLNDLVVTRDAVYATDSLVQQLVVVPLGRFGQLPPAATTLPLTGDIQFQDGFNANGIVASPNGDTLIIVQSNVGKLFAVDAASGVADEIELTGGDVLDGDGLELKFRVLYVVQNNQNKVGVVRLSLDLGSGSYTGAITDADLDVPSTATLNSGFLWAVNARFSTPPTPTTEYDVVRLPRRTG